MTDGRALQDGARPARALARMADGGDRLGMVIGVLPPCGARRMRRARAVLFAGVSLAALALSGGQARAQIVENWLAAPVDGDYNNGANWVSGNAPVGPQIAAFGASNRQVVDITASVRPYSISVLSGDYVFNIGNGVTTAFFVEAITVQGGSATVNNATGATISLDGSAFFSGAVTINNSAGAVISLVSATGLGSTVIANAGQITLGSGSPTLSDSRITTSEGGAITLTGFGRGGNAVLSFTGNGRLDISGLSTFSAGTTIASLNSASASSQVILGAKDLSIGATNADSTYAGVISGTGGSLTKTGTGTLTLSGVNSYTGGTTISAGTLVATRAGALGTGDITLNGGTLSNTASVTLTNDLSAAAGTTSTIVAADGTTLTFAPVTYRNAAGSSLRLGAAGSTGTISFSPANGNLDATAGPTEILGGVVRTGGVNSALSSNIDLTIAAGATLEIDGFGQVRTLTGAGDIRSTTNGRLDVASGGTFSGRIGTAGADALRLEYLGTGTLTLTERNLYAGGTLIRFGTLVAGAESLGTGDISFGSFGGPFVRRLVTSGTLSGRAITVDGSATVVLAASAGTTARLQLTNFTTNQSGRLEFGQAGVAGTVEFQATTVSVLDPARTLVFAGGTTRDAGGLGRLINGLASTTVDAGATLAFGTGGDASVTKAIVNNGALVIDRGDAMSFSGVISGTGSLAQAGAGVTTLSGANSYRGATTVSAGTLRGGAANSFSNLSATTVNTGGTLDLGGFSQAIASVALAGGTLTNGALAGAVTSSGGTIDRLGGSASVTTQSGVTTLTGTNAYTGPTAVNGGTLVVNGSITGSSAVTVAAGATIGGSGQLPSLTVAGTLAPGNSPGTLTVNGNLTLSAGAVYLAEVQGAVSDRVVVTGTAALAGTLRLAPLGGVYSFATPYTLLTAAGGASGAFATVETQGSFGDGVTSRVAYTATDVQLTLVPAPLAPIVAQQTAARQTAAALPGVATTPTLSPAGAGRGNAYAVALGIDRAVAGGANPSALFPIYNLPAAAIPAAVNQLSGEVHSAAPALAVSAADQFLRAMLDPFAAGRLALEGDAPGGAAFSALVRKSEDLPAARPAFLDAPRYSVWGAGFGSKARNDGSARIGSAGRDLDDGHLAVGADVLIAPRTVAGFAVSGGASRGSLAGNLGKVDAEAYQAGLYGVTRLGPLNLGAALAYTRLENDVRRVIPALGTGNLASSYATNAWSGRLQASAAVFGWNGLTLSPLAAIQTIHVGSPAVTETSQSGSAAGALALARRNDVTARSELGAQVDLRSTIANLPLSGYLRAGWAHYYRRDASVSAAITGLSGSDFVIDGAKPARNAALLSAGLDLKIAANVTLGARFDSELSGTTNRFGGSAQLRVGF